MADDNLPNEFDLIVIGTGFPESCIAAAASRIGKKVLHIDQNDFYGGAWASFNFENFISFLENNKNAEIKNTSYNWHIPTTDVDNVGDNKPSEVVDVETEASDDDIQWTKTKLLAISRRFNLDLCPKILFAAGALVELLISSNICRYAEFRAVDYVCAIFNEKLITVPCTRSDVFNTKDLTILEKRLLMKFLSLCLTDGEDKCTEDVIKYHGLTFSEYLSQQNLTNKIKTCIIQSMAMCNEQTPLAEGMERTRRFLKGLGRYGNTPFLYPMYGCGEIPQCFCRLCAVFGGIYCLKRQITAIDVNSNISSEQTLNDTNSAITLTLAGDAVGVGIGEVIRAKQLVSSHGNITSNLRNLQQNESSNGIFGYGALINHLSRGIFITSMPLGDIEKNVGSGGINLLRLMNGQNEAFLIQQSHASATCPKGTFIIQLITTALSDDPAADLRPFIAQVFNDKLTSTPKLLFSAYFTLTARMRSNEMSTTTTTMPIYCTAAPFYELDYDKSIKNAKDIFEKLYPNAEFLPRAPDPEEILVEGEDPVALNENALPEDLRQQLRELETSTNQMDIEDENGQENVCEQNMETE